MLTQDMSAAAGAAYEAITNCAVPPGLGSDFLLTQHSAFGCEGGDPANFPGRAEWWRASEFYCS